MTEPDSTSASMSQNADSIGRIAELINGDPESRLDADMKHVLDVLASLGARPIEYGTPEAARRQPRPADAVKAILMRQMREPMDDGVAVEDITIAGEAELAARLYRPLGLLSRLNPAILYFHGGGFVTGDLDSHDASARALARRTGAIVVSVAYRLTPEHGFPAAHDDAWAAWRWLTATARDLGADPRRLALAGEDAGANLAAVTALRARDEHHTRPVHQLLIHPIAGTDLDTASYGEALRARPIGRAAMRWRLGHLLGEDGDRNDARLNLVQRDDWAGAAPATVILARLDPLRSEGEALAETLDAAGVPVQCMVYDGVTQGFFGLGLIVTKALFAQADAAEALSRAFSPGKRA